MSNIKTFFWLFSYAVMALSGLNCYGQTTSALGRFTVDVDKGCTGMTVTITENETFVGPQYWYEGFDENEAGSLLLNYTYTTAGDFYLTQVINDDDLGPDESSKDSVLVSVSESSIPTFTLHNCDNHRVRVEITDDFYDSYRIDFTSSDERFIAPLSFSDAFNYGSQGSYLIEVTGLLDDALDNCGTDNAVINTIDEIIDPVLTSVETQTNGPSGDLLLVHTLGDDVIYNLMTSENSASNFEALSSVSGSNTPLNDVNTSSDYHCYRIDTYDACNEETITSSPICSVTFSAEEANGGNLLTWETGSSIASSYNILRDGGLLTNIEDPLTMSYLDTAVICNVENVYNVQPLFNTGFSLAVDTAIISNQSGDLPEIEELPTSTINVDSVLLTWVSPDTGNIPFSSYIIEKNINGRGWLQEGTSSDTTYIDDNPTFRGSHSYRILYSDDCGNLSAASPSTTPIILQQLNTRGRVVTYSWNRYETWQQGIRGYTLERVDETGTLVEEFAVLSGRETSIEFSPDDLSDKYVRIRAESLDEDPQFTYSNTILTNLKTEMFLPTGFTPDDDNLNDRFTAKGPSVNNFKMEIYNRWGNLIFTTDNNVQGWDGKINGQDSPEGTYIYKIFFEDGTGQKFDQSGAFSLFRKNNQ